MGNKNNTSGVSLAAIGEKLKAAREKKSVTIDQAQRQTHIHSTVLIALESGRSDEVLTPTYVKSFLKKYSSYLGLDPEQLVKEYMSLHPGIDIPSVNLGVDKKTFDRRSYLAGYFGIIRKVCLVLAGIFLLLVVVRLVSHFTKTSHKPSAGKTIVRAAKTPRAVPAKNAQKKPTGKTQVPQISQITIPDNEPITLVMKVKADVYVGVKRDGIVLFKRLLPKGAVETFTAEGKLNVSIAKARSVELSLNGRPLGTLSKGAIKDLEITRKGIKVK